MAQLSNLLDFSLLHGFESFYKPQAAGGGVPLSLSPTIVSDLTIY